VKSNLNRASRESAVLTSLAEHIKRNERAVIIALLEEVYGDAKNGLTQQLVHDGHDANDVKTALKAATKLLRGE
jgi:hypothetical protein